MLILTGRELYYLPLESGVLQYALNILRLLTPRLTCINIVHSISSEDASETPPKTYTSHGRSHRSIETHWCLSLSNLPVCGQLQLLACVFSCKGSLVSNQNALSFVPLLNLWAPLTMQVFIVVNRWPPVLINLITSLSILGVLIISLI